VTINTKAAIELAENVLERLRSNATGGRGGPDPSVPYKRHQIPDLPLSRRSMGLMAITHRQAIRAMATLDRD
jgi:hypothetical protein